MTRLEEIHVFGQSQTEETGQIGSREPRANIQLQLRLEIAQFPSPIEIGRMKQNRRHLAFETKTAESRWAKRPPEGRSG
jgi:hypothetical protein